MKKVLIFAMLLIMGFAGCTSKNGKKVTKSMEASMDSATERNDNTEADSTDKTQEGDTENMLQLSMKYSDTGCSTDDGYYYI